MQHFIDKFKIVSDLTPACFEYHPLWSEKYDYEELDEIESWGVSRSKV